MLIKMLTFIFKLSKNESNIDLQKVDNVIASTTFENLKTLKISRVLMRNLQK